MWRSGTTPQNDLETGIYTGASDDEEYETMLRDYLDKEQIPMEEHRASHARTRLAETTPHYKQVMKLVHEEMNEYLSNQGKRKQLRQLTLALLARGGQCPDDHRLFRNSKSTK